MRVAIYCGSTLGNDSIYAQEALKLGETLGKENIGLVYGAANNGIMGIVADAILQHGGEVIGVTPAFEDWHEIIHRGLSELHYVETMYERKAMMGELADAYIALPGGAGTMDEFFDIFTLLQLGQHNKKIFLYNTNGFYNAIAAHFDKMVQEGFLPVEHLALLNIVNSPEEVIALLK